MRPVNPRQEVIRLINWEIIIALESPDIPKISRVRLKEKIGQLISYWERNNAAGAN